MNSAVSNKNKVIAIFAVIAVVSAAILAQIGGTLAAPADKVVTLQCESGVSEFFHVEKGATATIGISYLSDARSTDTDVATVAFTAAVDGDASVTGVKAGLANLVYGNIAGKVGSFKFQITDSDNISGYTLKDGGEMSFEEPAGPGQGETKASPVVDVTGQADRIVWASMNEDVATVAANGDITAVGPGMTVVTGDFIDKWGVPRYIAIVVGVGGDTGGTGDTVTGITIVPGGTEHHINIDGFELFSAIVEGTGNVPQDVIWKIQHAKSTNITINADGLLNARDRSQDEYVIIRAISVADPSVYQDLTVSLENDYPDPDFYLTLYGESQEISGPVFVKYGDSQGFAAVDFETGDDITQDVIWQSFNNTSVQTMMDSDGVLYVGADETASYVVIRVVTDYGICRYLKVDLCVDQPPDFTVTGVTLDPGADGTASIGRDGFLQFSASVEGIGTVPQDVTWKIQHAITEAIEIYGNGLLFAPDSSKDEYVIIRATSVADPTKYKDVTVNMSADAIPDPGFYLTLTGGSEIINGHAEVEKGTTQGFSAKDFQTDDDITQNVEWELFNNNSPDTTIDEDGLLTVPYSETARFVVVRATCYYESDSGDEYAEYRYINILVYEIAYQ